MFNIVDLIGIIIIFICAFVSFKNGFVKTFFGFISTFVAIALAFILCSSVAEYIKNNTDIDEWLEEKITISLNNDSKEETIYEDGNVLEKLPETLQNFVGLEEYKNGLKQNITSSATNIIIKVLSWIIVYLVSRIILYVLCIIFNGIMNIQFLKQINNIAGFILGIILGFFRIYVCLAIVSFVLSVVKLDTVVNLIKGSLIIGAMYENNILLNLIF